MSRTPGSTRVHFTLHNSRTLWSGVLVAVALIVAVGSLSATSGIEEEAGIANQVRGSAHRPYVYRQLVPLGIRAVFALRPPEFWNGLGERMAQSRWIVRIRWATDNRYEWWNAADLPAIFLSAGVNLVALIAFAFVFRALVEDQFRAPEAFANATAAVTLYTIGYMNREGVYSYDCPLLFLFTLELLLLRRRAWAWFYPLFVLATLNKETSILLTVVFAAVYWRRLPLREIAAHAGAQLAIYGLIVGCLHRVFADNHGPPLEYHFFRDNVGIILNPGEAYGFVACAVIFVGLLLRDWEQKPEFLRRATVVFWPLLGLTALFGLLDELRDYYEFYLVAMPLVAATFARYVFGASVTARNHAPA